MTPRRQESEPPRTPKASTSRWVGGLVLASALAVGLSLNCGGDEPSEPVREKPRTNPNLRFEPVQKAPPGRWRRKPVEEQIDDLEAIGYMSGHNEAPDETGVLVNDARAYQGYNLYVSGHGPEAILTDMKGGVLHTWRCPFKEAVPDFKKGQQGSRKILRDFYRRAYLYPNGDLLAIFEGSALIKLDKDSNVLWAFPGLAHHDLQVMEDGRIYVLTRKGRLVPSLHEKDPILEDFVTILSSEGKVLRRVSVLDCFQGSEFEHLLERKFRGDFFHTNTLEVLDGRFEELHPAFRRGNVLISILWFDTIAVLDLDAKQVVWTLSEGWVEQHQPTFLDNGEILLLDNLGGDEEGGHTRILQFDPVDYELTWLYEGDEDNTLHTDRCGAAERLPNGNTLITESDNGRAIEITSDGEIVWEFVNPSRAAGYEDLIATLFEVVRLPPTFPIDWADGAGEGE